MNKERERVILRCLFKIAFNMNLHYKSPHAFINTISFCDEEIHTPEYFKREKIITLNCICIML